MFLRDVRGSRNSQPIFSPIIHEIGTGICIAYPCSRGPGGLVASRDAYGAEHRSQTNPPRAEKMISWFRREKIAITTTAMLVIHGIAISQVPARAFTGVNGYRRGYEMRVHLDRTLSITSSRVGDRFVATVTDPGPFNLARISGQVECITPSELFKGATEMCLSFDRIRFNDGGASPINAEIIKLYDMPSGEQVDDQEMVETRGRRRPQTLKRTGIGALAGGIFGMTLGAGTGAAASRPRVAAARTTAAYDRKELILDQGIEMLLRVYHD